MKNLQETGSYLEKKIRSNRIIAFIFLVIGLATILQGLGILFIAISIHFFTKASNYKSGYSGERMTIEALQDLPDSYYLINDVNLPESYGNIDHIVLGRNGIFIIETKNLEGEIRCQGDNWFQYKDSWKLPVEHEIRSPSKQVKGNALKLKQYIESMNILSRTVKLWVEGIVVLTHDSAIVRCDSPTVTIFKVDELCNYIKNKESRFKFSSQELEKIARNLLRH